MSIPYYYIYFLIRVLTIIPLTILVTKQVRNLKRQDNKDNKGATRIALLAITVALFLDTAFMILGDFQAILFGAITKQEFLQSTQPVLVFIRLLVLYAVWRFYRLVEYK